MLPDSDRNWLTPVAIWIGSLSWVPRFLKQITAMDKFLSRITHGRWSFVRLAGLPSMMLTVIGRKSGEPRSTPVLCVPYLDGYLIAGSNFGGPKMPAWVFNLRAAIEDSKNVGVSFHGHDLEAVAHECTGEEREVVWAHMNLTWPNYAKYAERSDRTIPVFLLEPAA
ncbi:nitroreductase family deazaflavin-dependent oxidoreductase [Nocardioides marmorisolisilvae]|uniref:Nitroreductase family deazaflavin-dependent oxidoreductase n=1 Tax=Nocardioides marmorisolisilvae TaxID=1542737 RepID=A0A3N0E0R9_9ACTN|nr:nitroreductase family deazaflavin-dependent oxidoreductase [Nocardioides marmorisolisilvae]RNL81410.1 nitroreductase family deazaflavin-dependent oxidoreductase [Nocardioides marmorisolisilvae]